MIKKLEEFQLKHEKKENGVPYHPLPNQKSICRFKEKQKIN